MDNDSGRDSLLLVLRQQQSRYAVPAEFVEEIVASPAITRLPRQPEYIRGVFIYKGHIVPVLSLQTLCGCGCSENEAVCVILRMGDGRLAISADGAESLIADSGQRLKYDESLLTGKLIALDRVLPGDPAVFVLDLKKTCEAVQNRAGADIAGGGTPRPGRQPV